VKIDSVSETDALAAVETLKSEHKITKLDIVIANAGIANYFGQARVTPVNEMIEHFQVNVVGPLLLFQATAELLDAAPEPKFFTISSAVGSISYQEHLPLESSAYGSSKAALNFVSSRIHFENPKILAAPVHPGWLQTDVSTQTLLKMNIADIFRWVITPQMESGWKKPLLACRRVLMELSINLTSLLGRKVQVLLSLGTGSTSHGRREGNER
jgi:NAD(P)-dependent dehydrogenase (short-subunit alcohol dehydrogenase family)